MNRPGEDQPLRGHREEDQTAEEKPAHLRALCLESAHLCFPQWRRALRNAEEGLVSLRKSRQDLQPK